MYPMEQYILVPQTRAKVLRIWLLYLFPGYKRAVLGTAILSNGITDISVQLTEMTRLVKVDHLERWSQSLSLLFWSNRTGMVHSIWFLTKISRILVWIKGTQRVHELMNMPPWVLPPVLHCNSKTYQWKRYIKLICHCFKCPVVEEPKGLVKLYSIALSLTTQKSPLGISLSLSHTHIPVTFIWEFPLPPSPRDTALQTWGWPPNFTVLPLAFFLGFILHH